VTSGVLARDSRYYVGPELLSCGKGTSNCCLSGQKCGTNLLCSDSTRLSRQYCADKNWDGCSTLCADVSASAGTILGECGDNTYCCGQDCDCKTANRYFVDPETGEVKDASQGSSSGSATWWSVDSVSLLASGATDGFGSVLSSVAVTSSSLVSASRSLSMTAMTDSSTSQATLTTAMVPSSSIFTSTTTTHPSKGLSAGAGAGIGIGSAAGVAGVATLTWLLFRKRKMRRLLQSGPKSSSQGPPSGNDLKHVTDISWGGGDGQHLHDIREPYTTYGDAPRIHTRTELDGASTVHEMH
jgi:hypothetical protein